MAPCEMAMKSVTVSLQSDITLLLNLTQQPISETDNVNYIGPKQGNR